MDFFNTYRKQIIGVAALIGIVIVVAIGWLYTSRGYLFTPPEQEVAMGAPVDIVLDYYAPWTTALEEATTTDAYKDTMASSPILSRDLRKVIKKSEDGADAVPPLCHISTNISARPIYEREDSAQVLVVSTQKTMTEQAIVTLLPHNGGWYINDISCSPGEFAPEREFSFENEGYLLKSVAPPLDPKNWHLVFEQNGEKGHVVPLFFDANSTCVALDGTSGACDPTTFMEPSRANVHGEMTETGVKVKRMELLKWQDVD